MRNKLLFALSFAMLTLLLGGRYIAKSASSSPKPQIAVLYLAKPTNIDRVLNELANYDVKVVAFHRQQQYGDQVITDGFYLTSEDRAVMDSNALRERYWQSYGAMLDDLYQDMVSNKPNTDGNSEETLAWQKYSDMIIQMKRSFLKIDGCWVSHSCPRVDILTLIILGNPPEILELSNSVLVKQINIKSLESAAGVYASTTPTPDVTPAPYNLWVPNRGSIAIHPSVVQGERYVRNRMRWDTASRLSAFGSTSTYEHDFFLNDSDGSAYGPGTYLSDAQDILDVPIVSHWSSTQSILE